MAADPKDEFKKLKARITSSYSKLERFRKLRKKMLGYYAGSEYCAGDDFGGEQSETLLNLIELLVNIDLVSLVSANPQCLVTSNRLALRTSAHYFAMAMNHALKIMQFKDALEDCVIESYAGMGVMKVGIQTSAKPTYGGTNGKYLPFADPIAFEDFVWDTGRTRWELIEFCGNKYRELVDDLKADPRNNQNVLKNMSPGEGGMGSFENREEDSAANLAGIDSKGEKGFGAQDDKRMKTCWDIWLPYERKVVTYIEDDNSDEPLREVNWKGPPCGPYHLLRYHKMPNNIMPVPPIANLLNLADLENELIAKIGEQASRQKTVMVGTLAVEADARTIIEAHDGQFINVKNPNSMKEVRTGGVDQNTAAAAELILGKFDFAAGNVSTRGGLATGADTATQEKLLAQNSSGRMQFRQQKVLDFTKGVMESVGWWMWNDPLIRMTMTNRVAGTEIEVESKWPMQEDPFGDGETDLRQGQFHDLNLEIIPFSLQDQPPQSRAAALQQIVTTLILPYLQILDQQGIQLDFKALVEKIGDYLNLPELSEIVTTGNEPTESESPVTMGKPASTTRTYDRVRGGGPSAVGARNAVVAGMAGQGGRPSGVNKA